MDSRALPEILSSEIAVSTGHFRIERLHLRFANGEKRVYERMLGGGNGAVMIVPVLGSDLLLVREYCAGTNSYELGFPKGRGEKGEDWRATAQRELREETGYGAGNCTYLRKVNSAPSFFASDIDLVLAEDLFPAPLDSGDEPEPMELVKWPLARAADLLLEPGFREARCLAALAAAMRIRHWQ
ncbi:MAG: ADP compounds hydrolase NudE [Succinivibrionaceae bacterium]|nr:ADP compounds hydrolase NudE [Succinivibrionaceae bacterium]